MKFVTLPIPEAEILVFRVLGEIVNLQSRVGGVLGSGIVPSERALVSSLVPPYRLFLYQHSFARNFISKILGGGCEPQSWGREGRRGLGIAPFECW